MKRINLKYSNKVIETSLPESWEEVTCEVFYRLQEVEDQKDKVAVFAALSGIDKHTLGNWDVKTGKRIEQHLDWIEWQVIDLKKYEKPKTIKFLNKIIPVPQKLEWETYGQYQMALQEQAQEAKPEKIVPKLCGIYLQKAYDGQFKASNIPIFIKEVEKTPIMVILPLYRFFLTKYKKSQKVGIRGLIAFIKQMNRRNKITISKQQEEKKS